MAQGCWVGSKGPGTRPPAAKSHGQEKPQPKPAPVIVPAPKEPIVSQAEAASLEELAAELERLQSELNALFEVPTEQFQPEKGLLPAFERLKQSARARPAADARRVFVFVGMPGSGKSVHIERLEKATGAPVFHPGTYAESRGLIDDRARAIRARGGLLGGIDREFLEAAAKSPGKFLILDGFPRNLEQAACLFEAAVEHGWAVEVLTINLMRGREVSQALTRQASRLISRHKGGEPPVEEQERVYGKVRRAVASDMPTIQAIRASGAIVHAIDSTVGPSKTFRQIRQVLGLDFESLDWRREYLEALADVSAKLGIEEAWLNGNVISRAFWNDVFGPRRETESAEILVSTEEVKAVLEPALKAKYPQLSFKVWPWRVKNEERDPRKPKKENPGPQLPPLHNIPARWLQAAARMKDGRIEMTFGTGAEADLRNGALSIDEDLLRRTPEEKREKLLQATKKRAELARREFPKLTLRGPL